MPARSEGEKSMKVLCTLSAALRLAFWLFVLGIALGLALRLPAAGAPLPDPGTASVNALGPAVRVAPAAESGC
jgi:hypothetical protein